MLDLLLRGIAQMGLNGYNAYISSKKRTNSPISITKDLKTIGSTIGELIGITEEDESKGESYDRKSRHEAFKQGKQTSKTSQELLIDILEKQKLEKAIDISNSQSPVRNDFVAEDIKQINPITKFCSNCGVKLESNAHFCSCCGQKVASEG